MGIYCEKGSKGRMVRRMGPKRGRIGREGKKAKGREGRGQRTMLGKQNVGCQWWKEES